MCEYPNTCVEHGVLETEQQEKYQEFSFFLAKGNEGTDRGRTQPIDSSSGAVHFLLGSLQSKAIYYDSLILIQLQKGLGAQSSTRTSENPLVHLFTCSSIFYTFNAYLLLSTMCQKLGAEYIELTRQNSCSQNLYSNE